MCRLIIFVKAPRPGKVKTRLAAVLGETVACAAYCRMVAVLRGRLSSLNTVSLCFSPPEAAEEVRLWLQAGGDLVPQSAGDLGERLKDAFAGAFARGDRRVVIIGSDSPAITQGDIELAWTALNSHEIVLGPARDGGYWLIGLRQPQPQLFQNMVWSTPKVLRETLERASASGLSVKLLHELDDIDTAADWEQFLRDEAKNDGAP